MRLKIQKSLTLILCTGLCAALIIFNSTAMEAAGDGFELWLTSVMPALFPFFVCTAIMSEAGLLRLISSDGGRNGFLGNMGLFFISAISGSPCGARMSAVLYDAGMIDEAQVTRVSAACNMLNPMFIVGSLGAMLKCPEAALPIAIGHYGASFIALVFSVYYKKPSNTTVRGALGGKRSVFRPLSSLSRALSDGTLAMVKICGTIVFFMVISRVLETLGIFGALAAPFSKLGIDSGVISSLITGGIEAVGGAAAIAGVTGITPAVKCAVIAFIITFGGVCILAQSLAFANISAKKYLLQKLCMGLLAAAITYAAAKFILPDSVATIGEITVGAEEIANNALSAAGIFVSSLLGLGTVGLLGFVFSKRRSC